MIQEPDIPTTALAVLFVGSFILFIVSAIKYLFRQRPKPPTTPAKLHIRSQSPVDFERHCADVLESVGWKCKTTRTSGDFGIDLIADHAGHRVAFQVKKWGKPVNLSAVQEVVAGMPMYRAHQGAVISLSGYQASARKLAAANNVRLLSYEDLVRFHPPTSQASWTRLLRRTQQ